MTTVSTILAIDDDRSTCRLLEELLTNRGYRVISADDAQSGLVLAEREKPNLIVLDVIMPGMDGWAALAEIRRRPALSDIPVILLTGDDSDESTKKAFAIKLTDYLIKPINEFHLFKKVENFLR